MHVLRDPHECARYAPGSTAGEAGVGTVGDGLAGTGTGVLLPSWAELFRADWPGTVTSAGGGGALMTGST